MVGLLLAKARFDVLTTLRLRLGNTNSLGLRLISQKPGVAMKHKSRGLADGMQF